MVPLGWSIHPLSVGNNYRGVHGDCVVLELMIVLSPQVIMCDVTRNKIGYNHIYPSPEGAPRSILRLRRGILGGSLQGGAGDGF